MGYEPPVVVYDACVLYPFHLRNVLIQIGVDGLVEPRWTGAIHAEWIRNLSADNPGVGAARAERTAALMDDVLPRAKIVGHEAFIEDVVLPDRDDRHVVAAAVAASASAIVTWNLRDFPADVLRRFGLVAVSPDVFLCRLYGASVPAFIASVAQARRNLRTTVPSVSGFLETLSHQRLTGLVALLRSHEPDLR